MPDTGADAIYQLWVGRGAILVEAIAVALIVGYIVIAADVVRTVALAPTLINCAALGLLVLVRSFLSWSIILEPEGRWPWQARSDASGAKS